MASGIASGISGGGTPIVAPESTIVGSASYTVPEGKLAVVSVTQGYDTFTVNGSPIVETSGREESIDYTGTIPHAGNAAGNNVITSTNPFEMRITGSFRAWINSGPGFQGSGSAAANKRVYIGPTLIYGPDTSHGTTPSVTVQFSNMPLFTGESLLAAGWQSWFTGDPSNQEVLGYGVTSPTSTTAMKMSLPAGTIIEGGRYVAEIYSV